MFSRKNIVFYQNYCDNVIVDLSKVEEIRKAKGISQKELCERSGINKHTYNSWRNRGGKKLPSASELKKIADALGVTVDTLTGNSGTPEAEEFYVKYEKHGKILEKISALHKNELGLLAEIIDVFYKFSKTSEIYRKKDSVDQ